MLHTHDVIHTQLLYFWARKMKKTGLISRVAANVIYINDKKNAIKYHNIEKRKARLLSTDFSPWALCCLTLPGCADGS